MKSTTFLLASLVASVAVAQPHRQHIAKHQKRDVALVTETDWVIETIDITTTVYMNGGTTPTAVAVPTSSNSDAGQYHHEASSAAPPASHSSSVDVAATPAMYTTPLISTQTPISTTAAAPAASSSVSSGGSVIYAPGATTSANCEVNSPCTGDITFYQVGTGACGTTNDGDTEDVIALPFGMMGTESNGGGVLNPFCGKTVTITKGSVSIKATVVDKCGSCFGDSIDLSEHAFKQLADESVGRTPASWYFN